MPWAKKRRLGMSANAVTWTAAALRLGLAGRDLGEPCLLVASQAAGVADDLPGHFPDDRRERGRGKRGAQRRMDCGRSWETGRPMPPQIPARDPRLADRFKPKLRAPADANADSDLGKR